MDMTYSESQTLLFSPSYLNLAESWNLQSCWWI